jgi:hypothetical protein
VSTYYYEHFVKTALKLDEKQKLSNFLPLSVNFISKTAKV